MFVDRVAQKKEVQLVNPWNDLFLENLYSWRVNKIGMNESIIRKDRYKKINIYVYNYI